VSRRAGKQEAWVRVGRRELKVSNLAKVMYPATGFTKGEVIEYYAGIAPFMLPHLRGRPITLKRYPDGVEGPFFYEKQCPVHRPEWVTIAPVQSTTKLINFCVIDDLATLTWVANIASLEIHTYLARAASPDKPGFIAFDLDPGPPAGVLDCIPVALRLREMLGDLGLKTYAKVSGGKGLHIYVPLNSGAGFDRTKPFAREVAQALERDDRRHITSNMRKDLRKGKIFVDWSQNDRHKTTVCVYSLRARQRPTVSMPVTWDELEDAAEMGGRRGAARLVFEAPEAVKRAEKLGDLFEPVLKLRQKLPTVAPAGAEG
jgi:bifunctional non-homologous end joining protein LigD